MANKKISELTSASLPLTGTEVVPIVQGGETKKVSVSEFKDVLEFANFASFPVTGESSKIYVTLDTNLQYRWSGSAYIQIGGGDSIAFQQRTGDEIVFDKNSIYNKTTPISTDISFDLTGAILGNKAIVFHNSTSIPSFLGVNLKSIIGYYIPNETNIIELIFLGGTDIIAEIKNQNTLLAPFNFDYSVSGGNLILTWDSYIDSNFIIERSTTSDFATKTQVYSGSALTYTDVVGVGVSYFYRIKSVKDNFTDSLWNVIQADNFFVGFLTFNNAKKNLLTALPNNEYTTSITTNYEAYGNSDYKIPANTYGFIEINTPDLAKEGSIFGFASTDVNGGFALTKFAIQTGVGTTSIAKFQNGVYIAGDIANGYSAGANSKLRIVREVSGAVRVFKTNDLITWVLVYTFPENYTGELYLVINVRNNVNVISRPFGYNLILK